MRTFRLVLSPLILSTSKLFEIRLLTSRELPRLVLPLFHSRSRTGHLHLSGGYLGDAGRAAGNTHGGDAFLHGGGGALGKVFLDHPIWCAAPRAGHAWVHVSPPHYQRTHHQKAGPVLQVCNLVLSSIPCDSLIPRVLLSSLCFIPYCMGQSRSPW